MIAPSFLASMVLGWTLGCCSIYALLRWANVHFAPAVRSAGAWALVIWVPFYMSVGMWYWNLWKSPQPDSLGLFVGKLVAFVGAFLVGSLLLRFLPHQGELWWHDVLFCAVYFGCAYVCRYALLISWPTNEGPLYEIMQWNGGVRDAHLLTLSAWLFPLGAPLMELLGRNLLKVDGEFASYSLPWKR
ncbi:hypothetical protein EON83_17790 [bacterium]|nr:MAG: hypothetical protein EON83_17790 [bacterium]